MRTLDERPLKGRVRIRPFPDGEHRGAFAFAQVGRM